MPSRQIGSVGNLSLLFGIEAQDVVASLEPEPGLLITTSWTPQNRVQGVPNDQTKLAIHYVCLEVRYVAGLPVRLPGRGAGLSRAIRSGLPPELLQTQTDEEPVELGLATLAPEETPEGPTWIAPSLFKKTLVLRLPLTGHVLAKVEQLRQGADFTLRLIPRGEIEEMGISTQTPMSYWLADTVGVSLEMPRSKWSDVLQTIGYPSLDGLPMITFDSPAAEAGRIHLHEAIRLVNLGRFDEAGTTARKALEELRESVAPLRPKKDDGYYGDEDVATRVRRAVWAANNFCNAAAHAKQSGEFRRAEAVLAIRQAAALIEYIGSPEESRGAGLAKGPTIAATTVAADYETSPVGDGSQSAGEK